MQWFWCIIDTLEKKDVKSKLKCESIDNDKKHALRRAFYRLN